MGAYWELFLCGYEAAIVAFMRQRGGVAVKLLSVGDGGICLKFRLG